MADRQQFHFLDGWITLPTRRVMIRTKRKTLSLKRLPPDQLELSFEADDDEVAEWTEKEIEQLREYMLRNALISLHQVRTSMSVRTEALEWVQDKSIRPFSFNVCACAAGYDPEVLREHVIATLRKDEKARSLPAWEKINDAYFS